MKYNLISFLLLFFLTLFLSACRSSTGNYVFKSSIPDNPKTLDPQCALSSSSYPIIYNVFQGLFTYNENGEIVNGMIDDFYISEDGLVWTFNIKKNVMWSDGDEFKAECTAYDYVFAFQRLFKPETMSERAGEFYIIKNAEKINKGKITDYSQLGVKASDKYTLEITLEKPYSNLKALLTLPPAMPCNEEFFISTEGRYGLAADCVASNHNFYVHTWSYDKWSSDNNYFILRRNSTNIIEDNLPSGVNFFIDPENEFKEFKEETLSVYSGKTMDETYDLINKYDYLTFDTGVWGIIFNMDSEFSDYKYRIALADYVEFTNENEIYRSIERIVPDCINIGEDVYSSITDVSAKYQNITDSNVGRLTSKRFIMPQNSGLRTNISNILQDWQSERGFYCNISELDNEDYLKALNIGAFDIALVKLSGEYNSPYAYLNNFINGNYENFSRYKNKKYEHIINSALTSTTDKDAMAFYSEAEQLLIDNGVFIPLCVETEYMFISGKISDIWYNPFSMVYSCRNKE